jgi:hypothetical protein
MLSSDKLISINRAVAIVRDEARKARIGREKLEACLAYVESMPKNDRDQVRLDQFIGLLKNIQQSIELDDPEYLGQRRGFRTAHVPDVIEASESKEFANQKATLWNSTKDNLWRIHHGDHNHGEPPCIIVLGGAAGTGKSETTWLSGFYTLLLLLMMHDPHVEFMHNPAKWIILVCQGIKEKTTKDSLFDAIQYAVDNSPWIQKNAPRRARLNEELQWPLRRIKLINLTGDFDAGLGKDVFWGGVTEINEMPVIQRSKRIKDTSQTTLDTGQKMWTVLENRISTRFSEIGGTFPGKLIADSARSHVHDFTSKMKDRAKRDKRILVIERAVWEAQVHKYPATEPRFPVELGDEFRPPRVLKSVEAAIVKNRVVMVPQRHRETFLEDCEQACKDFIGAPTRAVGRFIAYPEKITKAQTAYVEIMDELRPFKYTEISYRDMFGDLPDTKTIDWNLLINYEYFDAIIDKATPWTCHADMALTNDAVGFAFARIYGSKEVSKALIWNPELRVVEEMENIQAPIYMIDGILRIVARPGETIDPNITEALILELKRLINMRYGSADWFEAQQMLNNLKRARIVADKYSVDKTPDGYMHYKHVLRDERIIMQPHPTNDKETRELKRIIKGQSVQIAHPEDGCLSGDTRISLLDGTERTIRELAELRDPVYLYSCKEGYITVGYGVKPRLTQHDAETVIVTLDNDQKICCTPDHRFMMRDGFYKPASQLQCGDSLMPLYKNKAEKGLKGYELLTHPATGRRVYTHQMVAKWKYCIKSIPKGKVVHHNKGPVNNDPDQLQLLTRAEHFSIHHKQETGPHSREARAKTQKGVEAYWTAIKDGSHPNSVAIKKKWKELGKKLPHGVLRRVDVTVDEIKVAASISTTLTEISSRLYCTSRLVEKTLMRAGLRADDWKQWVLQYQPPRLSDPDCSEITKERFRKQKVYAQSELGRERSRENLKRLHKRKDFGDKMRESAARRGKITIKRAIEAAAEKRRIHISVEQLQAAACNSDSLHAVSMKLGVSGCVVRRNLKVHGMSIVDLYSWMPGLSPAITSGAALSLRPNNHKVISVEPGPKTDVFDISVPGLENFALSAGVFVHNSKDCSDAVAACVGVLERFEAIRYYKFLEKKAPTDGEEFEQSFGGPGVEPQARRNFVRGGSSRSRSLF